MEKENGWHSRSEGYMKFLVTMNMPSSNGYPVHQVIFEHHCESVRDLILIMNDDIFVYGRQFYRINSENGKGSFVDRGEIILNTTHIGKVQEYLDYADHGDQRQPEKQRGPLRSRFNNY
jgi:hypothetical protein